MLRILYALAQGMSAGLNTSLVADAISWAASSQPLGLGWRIGVGCLGGIIDAGVTYTFQGAFIDTTTEDEPPKSVSCCSHTQSWAVMVAKHGQIIVNGMVTYGAVKKFVLTASGAMVSQPIASMAGYEYGIAGTLAVLFDGSMAQLTGLSAYHRHITGSRVFPTCKLSETAQTTVRSALTVAHTTSHLTKLLTVIPGDWARANPGTFAATLSLLSAAYIAGISTTTFSFEAREALEHLTGGEVAPPILSPCIAFTVHAAAVVSGPAHGFEAAVPAMLTPGPLWQKALLAAPTAITVTVGNHWTEVNEAQEETRKAATRYTGRKATACCFGLGFSLADTSAGDTLMPAAATAPKSSDGAKEEPSPPL